MGDEEGCNARTAVCNICLEQFDSQQGFFLSLSKHIKHVFYFLAYIGKKYCIYTRENLNWGSENISRVLFFFVDGKNMSCYEGESEGRSLMEIQCVELIFSTLTERNEGKNYKLIFDKLTRKTDGIESLWSGRRVWVKELLPPCNSILIWDGQKQAFI